MFSFENEIMKFLLRPLSTPSLSCINVEQDKTWSFWPAYSSISHFHTRTQKKHKISSLKKVFLGWARMRQQINCCKYSNKNSEEEKLCFQEWFMMKLRWTLCVMKTQHSWHGNEKLINFKLSLSKHYVKVFKITSFVNWNSTLVWRSSCEIMRQPILLHPRWKVEEFSKTKVEDFVVVSSFLLLLKLCLLKINIYPNLRQTIFHVWQN